MRKEHSSAVILDTTVVLNCYGVNRGIVVIATILFHLAKLEPRFCIDSNLPRSVLQVCDDESL